MKKYKEITYHFTLHHVTQLQKLYLHSDILSTENTTKLNKELYFKLATISLEHIVGAAIYYEQI